MRGKYTHKTDPEKNPRETKSRISPDIILGIKEGNHQAFEKLFHTFYPKVKSFIKAMIHNEDLAEELTQQLFVDLWINREKADPSRNINAYIYTMARNSTITAIKQQVKFETAEFNYEEEIDNTFTDDKLIAQETELLINLTIAGMPPKRKQVYEMSRNENKSNEEIAQELKISKKVVEKHLRLALKELRKVLGMAASIL